MIKFNIHVLFATVMLVAIMILLVIIIMYRPGHCCLCDGSYKLFDNPCCSCPMKLTWNIVTDYFNETPNCNSDWILMCDEYNEIMNTTLWCFE